MKAWWSFMRAVIVTFLLLTWWTMCGTLVAHWLYVVATWAWG